MLIALSPAKRLDFHSPLLTRKHSLPEMQEDAKELAAIMAEKSPEDLRRLMRLSDELALLNWERFQEWQPDFTPDNARAAILAFKGDAYLGMEVERFTERDFSYAQRHLRILSGLHGVLRPLDLIQPYRLEMGTKLPTSRSTDLYGFWTDRITNKLAEELEAHRPKVLINLASDEYFSAVDSPSLSARIIAPRFLDLSRGEYRVVGFFAKRARGSMAAWLLRERVRTVKAITGFDQLGYRYSGEHSDRDRPTFIREPSS